ncbi:SCO2523 family variant P-loop protein [Actinoplanes solisilvae]|uniref:SCO2523 family variant P-loop protein n=1 Tax=Actinoplanes solisilvae TaxID=2486853 RepID=UPI000FD8DF72|nr:SCO2523 family variant P-loop protein [Actinoplanes solisilvae]
MLIFATSDKGGTGRSVTSGNMAYRCALSGKHVCYVDFDFGSPTAGAVFNIDGAQHGVTGGGLHSYLLGDTADPERIDIFSRADRLSLRDRPPGSGRLVLLPGDSGGGEFPSSRELVRRCATLFDELNSEFEIVLVDLSAGRSYAAQMVLAAARERPEIPARWLVFHRWTQQHIIAASSLVYGDRGILETGVALGHDREQLLGSLRFIRTAVVEPDAQGLTAEQTAWVNDCNAALQGLARDRGAGKLAVLGSVPLDPVLQWREQLITNRDLTVSRIANPQTAEAFEELARLLTDDAAWETI